MNIFRFFADSLHLLAIALLIFRIRKSRNCIGLSYKTQEIFLVTYCLRYLDMFLYFVSLYNTLMKVTYISATAYTIYLIRKRKPYCATYDQEVDSFPHYKTLYPAVAIVTLVFHTKFTFIQMFWSYSLWLEAVAFVPQIAILNRIKTVENMTSHYMAALGAYRIFYLMSWVYEYSYGIKALCWTQFLSGMLQTGLYADLLYYYVKSIREGKKFTGLPV